MPKVIARPVANDSEQAALVVCSLLSRLKKYVRLFGLIEPLLSYQAVLLSQIRKVEVLLLDSWAHRLVSTLKPRLPA